MLHRVTGCYRLAGTHAQCSAAAVQAAAQEAPEGLTLSQEELALYRLGFAQGFDAGQAAASAPVAEPSSSDEPMVWIPVHGGTKYHANATCSNMKSPMEVALSVALEKAMSLASDAIHLRNNLGS